MPFHFHVALLIFEGGGGFTKGKGLDELELFVTFFPFLSVSAAGR